VDEHYDENYDEEGENYMNEGVYDVENVDMFIDPSNNENEENQNNNP
jgi:hypothetical protein